jgi:hypothetical protein
VVVDSHPTHKAKAVKDFVAATDGRLKLFILPAYSRTSTPTNGSGRTSNTTASAAPAPANAAEFKNKVIGTLRRLQYKTHIIRAFFADPELRYNTA